MSKSVRRLFDQFKPENYQLAIKPDREKMAFSGAVTITGQKLGRPSQRLTFHQKGLKITEATITRHDRKSEQQFEVSRINVHQTFDEVRLHSAQVLYPGHYTIKLTFEGKITRPMDGIYPSFFEQNGKEQKIIATQFESHHAREVFPCIDEPAAKATFDLTLTTPKDEPVISNTPVKSQKVSGSFWVTSFATTPKMSTYLLAFVYGNFKHLEAKTASGTIVRAYATPDNVKFTKFALDCAVKILEFYYDYFAIDYPLPKCDLIALPDFAAGAMENWGCITFREQALLVDPKNTSLAIKQYVATVVAHELAHQWFGNLVTMRWWTDLWLNEGFASWIEYLAVDHLFPEWEMWLEFAVNEQEPGLALDALEHTHPIEVAINHPDEIRSIFDTISYSKGSSVLHMLQNYLSAETFRDGLRHYLKKHAYDNTDTVDLWQALEEISGKPVREFMHTWTTQPGFPLLHTEVGNKVTLRQERFFINPGVAKSSELWPLPLLAQPKLEADMLGVADSTYSLPTSDEPLLLNHNRSGFYRIAYSREHMAKLATPENIASLSELDRLSLLSDAFETAKAGYASSVEALKLLEVYRQEANPFVWDIIAAGLGSIRTSMNDETLRVAMKPFIRQLIATQLSRLGWQPVKEEKHFDTILRPTILSLASLSDESSVVSEALRRFAQAKTPEDLEPDFRGIIYMTAARHGGQKEFTKMLAMHNASTSSEERVTLSAALTAFKQPQFIQQALGQINSADVRLQDATYWLIYSFMNHHAKAATWQWMTSNWSWLEQNLGSDISFSRFPVYAARTASDDKFLLVFKKFFVAHNSPVLERSISQGVEVIKWQSAWRKRDLAAIKKFFKT